MHRVLLAVVLALSASSQQFEVRVSPHVPLSAGELAQLESSLRSNPADKDARLRLLRYYMGVPPTPLIQGDRLAHVLYWIENYPEDPVSGSALTYVPSLAGQFANPADHDAVRSAWLRVLDRNEGKVDVVLNAARFLQREHGDEAEQVLRRELDRRPHDRRIGANLGFLYAQTILSSDNVQSGLTRERAVQELERSQNVFVLAGAGTALPNLFPRTQQARDPNNAKPIFELASRLMTRARELAPNEAELAGPMPLIREFQAFQQVDSSAPVTSPPANPLPSDTAGLIRVGGNIQAAKLINRPEPLYPPQAREARIQGSVRFEVTIGRDGTVENVTLISGHPLLVPAASVAIRGYRYQPTLLNGSPVAVRTQVDVPFMLQP